MAVGVDSLHEFDVHMFYPPVLDVRSVLLEFAMSRRLSRSRRDIICSARLIHLIYNVDVVCR